MRLRKTAMLCVTPTLVLLLTAESCGTAPPGRRLGIEIVPTLPGAVEVGDTAVVPPGSPENPAVVASAEDGQLGVRQIRIIGQLTFSCYETANGSTVRTVPIDEKNMAEQNGDLPDTLFAQLDVSEESLLSRCGGNGAGSMRGQLQAEATFPDPGDPSKESVQRSEVLKFRFRTLAILSINIIGVDSTAKEGGVPIFADRADALAEAVSGYDIVTLQEVASKEQVDTLATKAGYAYSSWLELSGGHYDNRELAFLSRYPLKDAVGRYAPWLGCALNCPRHHAAAYAVTVDVDGRFPTRIVNTHFWGGGGEGNPRDDWRAEQAKSIQTEFLDSWPGRRIVVVGDTNGNSDLVISGSLVDIFDITTDKEQDPGGSMQTHCGDRIDVVFVRRPMAGLYYNGVGIGCARKMELSDHPVVAAILSI
jgi:endonuclease/exonuclease/phosphatase family metal-dependent hydrolase